MNKLLLILCSVLSLNGQKSLINDHIINQKKEDPRAAVNGDSLRFSEEGLFAESELDPLTLDGVSFDKDTLTYTLENVDFTTSGLANNITYVGNDRDGKTITMKLIGTNKITVTGEDDSNTSALMTGRIFGYTVAFTGTGSLEVINQGKALSTDSNDFECTGITNYANLVVEEGCTLKGVGGEGIKGSIGIHNMGTLTNKGNLIAEGGKSLPEEKDFDDFKNGSSFGLLNSRMADEILFGDFTQEGENATLTATSSSDAYTSYAIYCDTGDDADEKCYFNIQGGVVNATTFGCVENDDSSCYGLCINSHTKVNFSNATFNLENKSTLSCGLNDTYGYLEPNYCALKIKYDDESIFGDNVFFNCKAPTGIDNGFIATFEDVINSIYCLPENDEEIFYYGLEAPYPDEVIKSKYFDAIEVEEEETFVEIAAFIKTPTDGTVTIVTKESYYNSLKADIEKNINEYKEASTYGSLYQDKIDVYLQELSECTYDSTKVFRDNTYFVNPIFNNFVTEVTPIVNFVDSRNNTIDYMNNAIVTTEVAEVNLANEYVGYLNAITLDLSSTTTAMDKITSLKDEFDQKLAELRTPDIKEPEPEVEKSFPLGAIIAITLGSLVVIYSAGYVLWSKKAFAFMAKPIFEKIYTWFDKLVKKVIEYIKKLLKKETNNTQEN